MQNFTVTARERDTVLAALRYYQFYRMQGHPFDPRQDHLIDAIAAETLATSLSVGHGAPFAGLRHEEHVLDGEPLALRLERA